MSDTLPSNLITSPAAMTQPRLRLSVIMGYCHWCSLHSLRHSHYTASKTDDLSCSEIINALSLHCDPELEEIEERIEKCEEETAEWTEKKTEALSECKSRLSLPVLPHLRLMVSRSYREQA